MYKLQLNKKYLINTLGGQVINERCKVVGILTYDECIKAGYDVRILAFNERVLGGLNDQEYLMGLEYYKCQAYSQINQLDPNKYFIVWPEIINSTTSNFLEELYYFDVSIKVPVSAGGLTVPISTIRDDLVNYLSTKYRAEGTFKPTTGDDAIIIDTLQARIVDCETVLRSLQAFSIHLPTLERIGNNDLGAKINAISTSVDNIEDRLTTISAGLS